MTNQHLGGPSAAGWSSARSTVLLRRSTALRTAYAGNTAPTVTGSRSGDRASRSFLLRDLLIVLLSLAVLGFIVAASSVATTGLTAVANLSRFLR